MRGNYGNRNHRGNNRNNNFGGGRGRGRGRGRNFNSGGRNDRNNSKSQWQTNDRLTEPEAGITQFISDVPGFQGIIKSR